MKEYSDFATILRGGSLARALEHNEITAHCKKLRGKILDLGSGKSAYKEIFAPGSEVFTTDIDPASGADYIFDANGKFPIKNNEFDYVFCMNVIEHLKEPQTSLNEIHRILKKGGTCFIGMPFLFPFHASNVSDDCVRYTHQGLEYVMAKSGFRDMGIKRLGGRFSLILELIAQSLPTPLARMVRLLFYKPAFFFDEKLRYASERQQGKRFYLGIFAIAKK